MIFSLRLLACSVSLITMPVLAGNSIPLTWNPSAGPGVAGYKIYYGGLSHVYTNSVNVGNVTTATISGLAPNTPYFFSATSYDASGVESGFSNEAIRTILPPKVPTLTPAAHAAGQFAFNVSGITNQCVVQASTNMVNWVSIQTNTAPFMFVDSNAGQFKQRFYRTVYLP